MSDETTTTRPEVIDAAVRKYRERVDILAGSDEAGARKLAADAFTDEAVRDALEECVSTRRANRRGYGFLASPPTFAKRPAGSLWLRLWRWHGSGGQLDSYLFAQWDAERLERRGAPTVADVEVITPAWAAEIERGDLFDRLDTSVLLARGGSPAASAWGHALGTVTS